MDRCKSLYVSLYVYGWVDGQTYGQPKFPSAFTSPVSERVKTDHASFLDLCTQRYNWKGEIFAKSYHFRRRAGSEIEFLQVQEEAFQLSNQQE